MPGKVTHSEPSQERKWNRIKNGTGWRLTQEKEVRERKLNCLKRLEVTSHVTTWFFLNVHKIHSYTHVKHVFYVYNVHIHALRYAHTYKKQLSDWREMCFTLQSCLLKFCFSARRLSHSTGNKQEFPLEIHTFFNMLLHTIWNLRLQNHPLMQKSTETQHTQKIHSVQQM